MIKIPSIEQIRAFDSQTIADEGIASIDLMERAANAVANALTRRWATDVPVVVFAGPGNNGGDALAVARLLGSHGYEVEAYLFNTTGHLSHDCAENKKRLMSCPEVTFTEVNASFEVPRLTANMLVVDGLFGTGLNKPLTGGFALLAKLMNDSPADVVAIDVPSGLQCESLTADDLTNVVHADLTLTFQLPKLAMLLADTAACFGEVEILDIGLSPKRIAEAETDCAIYTLDDVRPLLFRRNAFGHKGTFGHALLIAGHYGMAGAAILCGRSCLRSGVGKVTIHSPQMNNSILQIAVPEAVLSHDSADMLFTTAVSTARYDAVAIGSGLGTELPTAAAFFEQCTQTDKPLLIDADGLNILADHPNWLNSLPPKTILTPHVGEFQRLTHHTVCGMAMLAEARNMAITHDLYIVLKGHRTAICTPEGKVYFNATGNSGMATAGSGDVLTGIITALLAQHYPPLAACLVGVYLHGLAGDIAAEQLSEDSLVASDIIDHLPAAFKVLRSSTSPKATTIQ